jgi:beta-glucanase (GH16 family)
MDVFPAWFLNFLIAFTNAFLRVFHTSKAEKNRGTIDPENFELTFSDDFDGDSLDPAKWDAHEFYGMRKGGWWSGAQARVENGNLVITTQYKEDGEFGPGWYTCGLSTEKSFQQAYGYFECRCILPKGVGLWSAFWMISNSMAFNNDPGEVIGGADGAEVDAFESAFYESKYPRRVSSNIHVDGYGEYHRSANVCTPYLLWNDPYENFNTYGLEWNEKEYIFYVNGVETARTSFGGVCQVPLYLILSVGVDEKVAGNEYLPASFIVDYVRCYQYK